MTIQTAPNKPISALTVTELENLIAEIVRRVLREEFRSKVIQDNGRAMPKEFLATFGAWEDERSTEQIISEIYDSRNVSTLKAAL